MNRMSNWPVTQLFESCMTLSRHVPDGVKWQQWNKSLLIICHFFVSLFKINFFTYFIFKKEKIALSGGILKKKTVKKNQTLLSLTRCVKWWRSLINSLTPFYPYLWGMRFLACRYLTSSLERKTIVLLTLFDPLALFVSLSKA